MTRGDGYSRVEMSFNGSLNIKQTGHAMLHIDKYNEDYLIPFPDFKVRGSHQAIYTRRSRARIMSSL